MVHDAGRRDVSFQQEDHCTGGSGAEPGNEGVSGRYFQEGDKCVGGLLQYFASKGMSICAIS